jgi:hypothetical protein
MRKIISLSICLFVCNIIISAKPLSQSTCETVAKNFYATTTGHAIQTIDVAYIAYDKNNIPLYFVLNINTNQSQDKGFVIIAADDAVYPIIGYGNENRTYSIPSKQGGAANVAFWMKARINDITQVRALNITPDPAITVQWQGYLKGTGATTNSSVQRTMSQFPSSAVFLVQSLWDQSTNGYETPDPYNYLCPNHSVTGCVATAMAQIMRYWRWPSYGVGASCDSMSNYSPVTICDNYSRRYNWNNMTLASPPGGDTSIARLMYDVGISVGMEYSQQGSDAQVIDSDAIDSIIWKKMDTACAQNALVKYFRYNRATIKGLYASDYSDSNWIYKLKAELDSNRPINYAGYSSDTLDGHSWICDGYDAGFNFHFNFGWGGADDGWYALTNLSPWYTGITFNTIMEGLMGIEPDTTISLTSLPALQTTINTVDVYPNPGNGTFIVKSESIKDKSVMEVYNMLGEKVYTQWTNLNSQTALDLSDQPQGVYLYRILNERGNLIGQGKLVIQK